jgi:hypothetical protein
MNRILSQAGLSITAALVAAVAAADGPYRYEPIPACRVLDTRLADGPGGGPALDGATARTITVPARCPQVPADATSVAVVLATYDASAAGRLRLFESGTAAPHSANLEFVAGKPAVASALVNLSAGGVGAVSVGAELSNSGTVHVTVDVVGWFGPGARLSYFAVPPCRAVDTRRADDILGGPALADQSSRHFPLGNQCQVPADVEAVVVTLTTLTPSGAGDIAVDAGTTRPISVVMFPAAVAARTGSSILRLEQNDKSAVVVASVAGGGSVHLVIDVTGYYKEQP